MADKRLRIAVLISAGGTTLKNLLEKQSNGQLDLDIVQVISSNPHAAGLSHAAAAEIASRTVRPADYETPEQFSEAIFQPCRAADVDYVVMGGFLKHVLIPGDFENRVINIHPGLIPAFCGKGFYGARVHQAVLDHGAKVTGCTIHFVDDQYDHGPIILQRVVSVENDDTAESLAARVFAAECEAYPEALRLLASGRVRVDGQRVSIAPSLDS
jgi:phosphoribosylglycinamide formyltransferase-1